MFGWIAGYSFAVAVVSGVLLLPFFRPSMAAVVYHGSYRLLDGVTMTRAYSSVLAVSFDVRGGLLIRQVHHWSAEVFVAAICLRLLRSFFRGWFSGRALPGWLIWVALLPLGMLAAYTGTILPDDMLSGGSLSVITGVLLSVPVIGTHLVFWIFGGAPPGHQIIGRDYWVHILVLPALAGALLLLASGRRCGGRAGCGPIRCCCSPARCWSCSARLRRSTRCGCTGPTSRAASAPVRRRTGTWDSSTARCGSCRPGSCRVAGHPLALDVLVPGLLVPGAFFTLLAAYPLLERRLTGDQGLHHVLGRPRDAATRTAAGAAGITFYGLLWAAAANDQIAYHLHLDLYAVTWFFRIAVLAGPPLAYTLTQRICLGLTARERDEAEHGRPTGRIVMSHGGGFSEITEPVRPVREEGPGSNLPMQETWRPDRSNRAAARQRWVARRS